MSKTTWAEDRWNPWKMATVGLLVVLATALVTGVVVAHYVGGSRPQPEVAAEAGVPAQPGAAPEQQATDQQASAEPQTTARPERRAEQVAGQPSPADVRECNRYASAASRDKATETLKDGLLGGALGAGLGAASGAIAGGGGGAGRGAGIGGLVGAAAGTLYGLSEGNRSASAAAAYRACMKRRGYVD